MTAGVQCDGCRTFAPMPAADWLHLIQTAACSEEPPGFLADLDSNPHQAVTLSFCTWRCVAEYATARELLGEDQTEITGESS